MISRSSMWQISSVGKCKIGFGLFVAFFLFQCSDPKPAGLPEKVISPEKMEELLFSLHEQEARLLMSGIRQDTAFLLFDSLQMRILNRLKVDTTTLRLSLEYYTQHLEILDSLYRKMEKRAQEKIDSTKLKKP